MAKVEYLGPRTARRMTVKEWLNRNGYTRKELIEEMCLNMVAPALCTECYDWVEVDGACKHGFPSVMRAVGAV